MLKPLPLPCGQAAPIRVQMSFLAFAAILDGVGDSPRCTR
jgi:hypothetical protein